MFGRVSGLQIIKWAETNLTVPQGPRSMIGKPLALRPWERRFIRGILGAERAFLTVARSNGKSLLSAVIIVAALVGPLKIKNGEIACVASSLGQARKVFRYVRWFLKPWFDSQGTGRLGRWRVIDNSHQLEIEDREDWVSFKALGSDPKRAHSMAPVVLVLDELAQWPVNNGPAMFSALASSGGKQEVMFLMALGTRPTDPAHIFSRMLKGGEETYVQVHACTKEDDDFSMTSLHKANPMAKFHPHLLQELLKQRKRARTDPQALAIWRSLHLNKGTSDVADTELLVDPDQWRACERRTLPPREGPLKVGIDIGGSSSMTCGAAYWPETGRFEARGAFPARPGLLQRGRKDFVGDRYVLLEERGEVRVYPGLVTPVSVFLKDFLRSVGLVQEGQGDPQRPEDWQILADSYKDTDVLQALLALGFSPEELEQSLVFRRMGAGKEGSADIRAFQAEVLEAFVFTLPSLLMESAILDSTLKRDSNQNMYLDKSRAKARIDAAQAAVLAVGAGRRWRYPEVEDPDDDPLNQFYNRHEEFFIEPV